MDAVFLSRIQFSLTSMFHYIYPPMSIGLGLFLVIIEGMYIRTNNLLYQKITHFWVNVFALTFALGVATGLVQMFGFGTNWASYSRYVGDVFGSALGAEGIFAFFLEAGFLGIMLFGWNRVSKEMHYFATWMVALGAHFSAIWIVVANSWMQTPAGYRIVGTGSDARAVVTNFWQMLFNPSSVDRLIHVILGCWLAGIFLVISISAYYFLKRKHLEFAKVCMKIGLILALVVLILQLISGDSTSRGVAFNQPEKLAAMEGIFETKPHTPITVLGWVDAKAQKVRGIQIPSFLSYLIYRDASHPVKGFDQIPPEERPPIQIVFQTFHAMVMCWALMFLLTLLGLIYWRIGKFEKAKWLQWGLVFSVFLPQIANQVGWMTAEIGRQPWIVYKLLRTADGVSKSIVASQVGRSIGMFLIIYTVLFILFLFLLDRKIKHGPEHLEEGDLYAKSRG
jgi:cytochrome bd ubiquinol oxidase subunit I